MMNENEKIIRAISSPNYVVMTEGLYLQLIERIRKARKFNVTLLFGAAGVWIYKRFKRIYKLEEENEKLKAEIKKLKGANEM